MFEPWKESVTQLLGELRTLQLGYPLEDNTVFEPNEFLVARTVLANRCQNLDDTLLHFYEECDGISWPDVHNGYFLRGLSEIAGPLQDGMPVAILADETKPIIVIGSTGGGSLFAVDMISSEMLLLPVGKIVDGVYEDPTHRVSVVGGNMVSFAERLQDDLKAFVTCRHGYKYLA